MTVYEEPVQMVLDIREHVLLTGHQVAPFCGTASRYLEESLGYVCHKCLGDIQVGPEDATWMVGTRYLPKLEPYLSSTLRIRGSLRGQMVWDRLTDYLNGIAGVNFFDLPEDPPIDRYHRPWVI